MKNFTEIVRNPTSSILLYVSYTVQSHERSTAPNQYVGPGYETERQREGRGVEGRIQCSSSVHSSLSWSRVSVPLATGPQTSRPLVYIYDHRLTSVPSPLAQRTEYEPKRTYEINGLKRVEVTPTPDTTWVVELREE